MTNDEQMIISSRLHTSNRKYTTTTPFRQPKMPPRSRYGNPSICVLVCSFATVLILSKILNKLNTIFATYITSATKMNAVMAAWRWHIGALSSAREIVVGRTREGMEVHHGLEGVQESGVER